MLGAGEREEEIAQTIDDLAAVGCAILTLGQYLSPSAQHVPVDRFVEPDEFDHWYDYAMRRGFRHVESGPLVRSSYHAEKQVDEANRLTDGVPDALLSIDPVSIEKE
jgi:lipoic acid synthetase